MSSITYDDIDLELTNITRFDQRDVYDSTGTDYQCTHVLMEARCVFNPRATAQILGGVGGARAAVSLAALRQQMMQPRKKLIVKIGNDTILESPPGKQTVDVQTGPKPLYLNVLGFHGSKSITVVFAIETWINECAAPHVLLSNRWRMRHDIDDLEMTARVIEGEAVFSNRALATLGFTADDFRQSFNFRVPDQFQRAAATWQLSEDGRTVYYQIRDEQRYWQLGLNCPALKVRGEVTVHDDIPFEVLGAIGGAVGGGLPATAAQGRVQNAGLFGRLVGAAIPMAEGSVKAWGAPTTSRDKLADFAIKVLLNRLLADNLLSVVVASSVTFGVDTDANWVEVRAAVRQPSAVISQRNPLKEKISYDALVRTDNDFTSAQIPLDTKDNPPWADKGTRGSYLNKMMSAALLGECEVPKTPPGERASSKKDAASGGPF